MKDAAHPGTCSKVGCHTARLRVGWGCSRAHLQEGAGEALPRGVPLHRRHLVPPQTVEQRARAAAAAVPAARGQLLQGAKQGPRWHACL